MVKDQCYTHEYHQEAIKHLLQACEQNTRVSADNATTLKLFIKLVGGSLVILVTIISVILPLMYQDAQRINAQILTTISGVSQNKNNIKKLDVIVHEHDMRLRDGGL
jgi:cell division protein FtsL